MSPVRSPRLCALLASPLQALAPAVSALAAEPPSSTPLQTVDSYMRQQDGDRCRAWDALQQPVSSQQFVDLRPGDWAYQALLNLVERHGCVAGSADGPGAGDTPGSVFRGAAAITRFEAAALLHSCLDTIHERTDSLQR